MPDTPSLDFSKARLVWSLTWDADWVSAVSFCGTTRKLVAGNNAGQLLLWELPEKASDPAPLPRQRLEGHTNVITRLLASQDGRTLISSSYDHSIRVWDLQAEAKGEEKLTLNARERERALVQKRKQPMALEAKVTTLKSALALSGHKDWVTAMSQSRDGKLLVSGDENGDVIVWDRATNKEQKRWKVKGWVYAIALSPDTKHVLATERLPLIFDSSRHAGVKIWDRETAKVVRDLGETFKGMHLVAASYSPDGKVLAIGRGGEADGLSGVVTLVDPATGKKTHTLTPGHLNGLTDLAFHPEGGHLATSGRDTVVRIWDVKTGKLLKELGKPRGGQFKDWIHAVSFSADGKWLAAADMAGAVHVWSLMG